MGSMERRKRNGIIAASIACILVIGALYLGVRSQKTHVQVPPVQTATTPGKQQVQQESGAHITLADYMANQPKYQDYQLIYFFKTDWCFVCNVVKADMRANPTRLPAKTVFVEVDFEKDTELRQKYNVQQQASFVQVDEAGKQIAEWQPQNLGEVLAGIKKV